MLPHHVPITWRQPSPKQQKKKNIRSKKISNRWRNRRGEGAIVCNRESLWATNATRPRWPAGASHRTHALPHLLDYIGSNCDSADGTCLRSAASTQAGRDSPPAVGEPPI